jgi:SAM-dependent methyltransferase
VSKLKDLLKQIIPEKQRLALRYASFKVRGLFYRGTAVHCPCCGGNYTKFLAYGSGPDYRPDALCPSCHTLERHRLLWLYLRDETPILTKKLKVLHFAPEPGLEKRLKDLPNISYISADLYSPLAMQQVDIMDMPYADNSFDVILCSHVLAHVPDDIKAKAEMHRVLKPGGFMLLQSKIHLDQNTTLEAPAGASENERQNLLGQADRFRNYGLDYAERVRLAGFCVDVIDYGLVLGSEKSHKFGLGHGELIFYCIKQ